MSKTYVFMDSTPTEDGLNENRREVWFPKTGQGYFDPVTRQHFDTKRQKRAWLKKGGMRECGELIRPDKHIEGRQKKKPDPHRAAIQEHIRKSGGTEGLLNRIKQRKGNFL